MGLFEANHPKSLLSPATNQTAARDRSSGQNHLPDFHAPHIAAHIAGESLALAAMQAAVDQKGLDVRGLDIGDESDVADYFVIVSGTSERHVRGIADKVSEALERLGERALRTNGYEEAEWVLLDYGNVVVHIFYEPMRQYYGLDELWGKKATEIEPGAELELHMRRLRTGIAW
ncbi:MAG: ribosome silencing factor [Bdellovibrionota bacterium]